MIRHVTPRILLGSTNPAKIDRLRDCLAGWPFQFLRVSDLSDSAPPEEAGKTHRVIAESKALAWARQAGCVAIASDGGIDIPALGSDWSSLLTRRAAGQMATDDDRIAHLRSLMAHLTDDADRAAIWREAIVIAAPPGVIRSWEAEDMNGIIRREPAQTRIEGFWLACLVQIPQFDKAYSELTADERREIGSPWTTLAADIQAWLSDTGYEILRDRQLEN